MEGGRRGRGNPAPLRAGLRRLDLLTRGRGGGLRGLPFQGFEVDAKVPMALARRLLGEKVALKGNLDTTFLLQASPEEVKAECRRILAEEGMERGIVLSPGCGVPRMTPLANLHAMLRACEEHAVSDGGRT